MDTPTSHPADDHAYAREHASDPVALTQMYGDILKGFSVYLDVPFLMDVRATAKKYPHLYLGFSMNGNQMASKRWLVESLYQATGGELGHVCVLGGWYGVLGAMLLHDPRFNVSQVTSIDIDPACEEVALSLNATHAESGKFRFEVGDMFDMDYAAGGYNLVVNTSTEHVTNLEDWFNQIPAGTKLVMQSNNYFGVDGHVNCVNNLDEFKVQVPVTKTLFEGQLDLPKYTRFMVIGEK